MNSQIVSVIKAELDNITIPPISYEWMVESTDFTPIVNDVLGLALILCGVYLAYAWAKWVANKNNTNPMHQSRFFTGGPGLAMLAALLIGSLKAAMEFGINIPV